MWKFSKWFKEKQILLAQLKCCNRQAKVGIGITHNLFKIVLEKWKIPEFLFEKIAIWSIVVFLP